MLAAGGDLSTRRMMATGCSRPWIRWRGICFVSRQARYVSEWIITSSRVASKPSLCQRRVSYAGECPSVLRARRRTVPAAKPSGQVKVVIAGPGIGYLGSAYGKILSGTTLPCSNFVTGVGEGVRAETRTGGCPLSCAGPGPQNDLTLGFSHPVAIRPDVSQWNAESTIS